MRYCRGVKGDQLTWFDEDEIEAIAEEAPNKAKLLPTSDNPVTDLERFVEGHLGVGLDQYAELEPGVRGLTEFVAGRPFAISINRDLTGSALDFEDQLPGPRGGWRVMHAHEVSQILLHRFLFGLDPDQGQLSVDNLAPSVGSVRMRCLKRDVGSRAGAGDWREVQANRGMAALLMPRRAFKRVAIAELSRHVARSVQTTDGLRPVVAGLAERFEVPRQAACIRLATPELVANPDASPLPSLLAEHLR